MTSRTKSLSGATIISCFFDRIRRNVRSLEGSKSRTTLRALSASWLMRPAYCTVVVLSRVLFTGIPANGWVIFFRKKFAMQLFSLLPTFIVHHDCSHDSLMGLDALEGLFNFLRLKRDELRVGNRRNRTLLTILFLFSRWHQAGRQGCASVISCLQGVYFNLNLEFPNYTLSILKFGSSIAYRHRVYLRCDK